MIPILFDKSETSFTSNGLGRLADCNRCIVTEERNGIYECEFDYPVSGILFDQIQEGQIIGCTHDEQGDIQPFDIYGRTETINGIVTFYAHHISYRLSGITAKPFEASSCADAMQKIKINSIGSNPFTFWTNKSVTTPYTVEDPKSVKRLLGGEEGSILDIYGTGEYEFDKLDVKLFLHRGQDTNVSIRYGKNLVDFTNDYSTEDSYTAVVPYWRGDVYTEGEEEEESTSESVLVTLPEWYISSGEQVPGGREIYVPMDLSAEFDEKPTVEQLRTMATSRLDTSKAWLPEQTVTVDFVQMWQTEEYKEYAPLQRLKLCDTCGVFVPMYDMSLRAKVIKVVYNVLLDRYDQMELGDKPTAYAAVLEKQFDSKVAGVVQGFQAIAVDLQNYADSEISSLKTELETQIDAKIETWAQSSNPASSWTTSALKASHNGDLWLYTGTSTITVDSVSIHPQGVYKYNGSTGKWEAYSSTSYNLFDLVDGKSTIFYGSTSGTYANKEVGDYLVDSSTGNTYRWTGSAWSKVTDYRAYTDNEIASAKTTIKSEYEQAVEDATDLIRGGTGGYVVTTVNANGQPIELLITDNINLNQAVNVWRWNQAGLGHSSNGYAGPFSDIAITQDGKINASMITTGSLNADLVTAGILKDKYGNNYFNLDTGSLVATSVNIGGFKLEYEYLEYALYKTKLYNGKYFKTYVSGLKDYADVRTVAFSTQWSNSETTGYSMPFYVDCGGRLLAEPIEWNGNDIVKSGTRLQVNTRSIEAKYTASNGEIGLAVGANGATIRVPEGGVISASDYQSAMYNTNTNGFLAVRSGGVVINTGRSTTEHSGNLYIDGNGGAYYANEGSSSRHIKHDIKPVENKELKPERLYEAEVIQYKYNDDFLSEDDGNRGRDLVGFIVEDLDEIYPCAVQKEDEENSKTWTWSPYRIIPAMLKLIQEQHEEIESIKSKLN